MNPKAKKKLAAALAIKAATEKALLLAEVAAKRAETAKVDFKLAKKTWKLARKAAKRATKEAGRSKKELAKVAALLKNASKQPRKRPTAKAVKSRTATKTPPRAAATMQPLTTETVTTQISETAPVT